MRFCQVRRIRVPFTSACSMRGGSIRSAWRTVYPEWSFLELFPIWPVPSLLLRRMRPCRRCATQPWCCSIACFLFCTPRIATCCRCVMIVMMITVCAGYAMILGGARHEMMCSPRPLHAIIRLLMTFAVPLMRGIPPLVCHRITAACLIGKVHPFWPRFGWAIRWWPM